MRPSSLAAVLVVSLPFAVQGQPAAEPEWPVSMTYCKSGHRCMTCVSEMPRAKVNRLLDLELFNGEVLVFTPDPEKPDGDAWKWNASGMRYSRIVERSYDGRGTDERPPACGARAALPGSIQPRSGQWRLTNQEPVARNCPSGTASKPPDEAYPMQFETPFRGRLAEEDALDTLVQVGPNRFAGLTEAPGSIGTSLLEVHSPTAMTLSFRITSADPGSRCEITVSARMDYEGPAGPPAKGS